MMWRSRTSTSDTLREEKPDSHRKNSLMAYGGAQYSNHFHAADLDEATTPFRLVSAIWNSVLATALFRCWHILVFYLGWATAVVMINEYVTSFQFAATILTVVGTVLGFVISYRTTSSFERYNEGRRLWSQIIFASRTLARAVWFHVPDLPPANAQDEREKRSETERRARNLIEKKTVINLIEAFSVAVKHYLRGEEGIAYVDLYHLVKFLPSYAFPAGLVPSELEQVSNLHRTDSYRRDAIEKQNSQEGGRPSINIEPATPGLDEVYDPAAPADANQHVSYGLPLPVTEKGKPKMTIRTRAGRSLSVSRGPMSPRSGTFSTKSDKDVVLLPASMPPKHSLFDIFPLSLFVKCLWRKGREVQGKKAARIRAKTVVTTRNVPLEISMYLTSYVSALQQRKAIDVPTTNLLIATVNQLTDALTGLERILTTPIPFSYSIHLWLVTLIYCLALPLQIYATLRYVTIPATGIISFVFFGFLVAGEEIENPFGYDKNDLNMDHFTRNIIRNELRALTAFPPPAPDVWVFSPRNDRLFSHMRSMDPAASSDGVGLGVGSGVGENLNAGPAEWVQRGPQAILDALSKAV